MRVSWFLYHIWIKNIKWNYLPNQCNKFMVLSIILDVLPINHKINFPWTRFAKEELIRSSNGERSSSYVCPKLYCWHRTQEPKQTLLFFVCPSHPSLFWIVCIYAFKIVLVLPHEIYDFSCLAVLNCVYLRL